MITSFIKCGMTLLLPNFNGSWERTINFIPYFIMDLICGRRQFPKRLGSLLSRIIAFVSDKQGRSVNTFDVRYFP